MASLIPELDAFHAAQGFGQQQQMGQLQQMGALQGILAKQQAAQREKALRGVLSQLPHDATPDQVVQAIRPFASADDILKITQGSADRNNALKLAQENRAAQMDQARVLQTERLESQREIARQRSEDQSLSREEQNRARMDMIRLTASLRPPPQTQPLVPIIGPDGKPRLVERKDAVNAIPAGAGSKAEATETGKSDVDKDVMTLKTALDSLNQGGGITSTEKGVLPNVQRWASTTGPGQLLGSMGGTVNQKNRDVILQSRPLLLRSIMQATGMSAKQLDSNAELKLWLSTATDPTKGYEANIEALNNIASKFGTGGFMDSPQRAQGSISQTRRSDDVPQGIDPKVWGAMTPAEKKLFK